MHEYFIVPDEIHPKYNYKLHRGVHDIDDVLESLDCLLWNNHTKDWEGLNLSWESPKYRHLNICRHGHRHLTCPGMSFFAKID